MLSVAEMDLLVAAMRRHGVTRLEVAHHRRGWRIDLALPEGGGVSEAPPSPAPVVVASPGIGTFAPRGGDDGLPELAPGAAVMAGEVLGYVAQGPVRQIIAAPGAGTLRGPLPEAGQVCGFGDGLFEMEAPA
ncbi:MAG TPA: hypothetical protein VLA78_11180 [Paracoccaceae bacterium]|nr:hypothetical protein [Paracoccaceae bacterium]